MTRRRHQVAIVGGGPVGLGLAIELGQRGIRAAVVERSTELHAIPKGQNLTQRSMEHCRVWGVEEAVRSARQMPPGYPAAGINAFGTLTSELANPWFRRSTVRDYYFATNERVPQYGTEAALRARVAELDTVDVAYGSAAVAIEQSPDGVIVTHEGGTVTADYAVGCDGSRSLVREQAGITETSRDHDRRMVLLVFRSTELHDLLTRRYGQAAFFNVLHPDLDGYWRFLGRVDVGQGWFFHAPVDTEFEPDEALGLLHDSVGAEFRASIDRVGFWDLRVAVADSYRSGRVFIAGDAAHSHPPYGGYGINTGFEDARNLGWKLAADLDGWAGPDLLDSYTEERRAVFASTAEEFIEAFIERDREFIATYADAAEPAVAKAWHQRAGSSDGVIGFAPHYSGSSLTIGGVGPTSAQGRHSHDIVAGHHLAPPHPQLSADLFDRLGTGFAVIGPPTMQAVIEALTTAMASRGVPHATVVDDRWAAAALVRPDHYVAWTGAGDTERSIVDQAVGA